VSDAELIEALQPGFAVDDIAGRPAKDLHIAGVRREYLAQITEQTPDQEIAWVSTDKPRNAGTVTFEPPGPDLARDHLELEWEPEGMGEKAGSASRGHSREVQRAGRRR